ncbi:hypothetical protein FRAHR75_410034 [Frankia sp. Hr75.2]|nr:hypothetical protein FRAHR75_410034 [Frankia sp. Hr75.2]
MGRASRRARWDRAAARGAAAVGRPGRGAATWGGTAARGGSERRVGPGVHRPAPAAGARRRGHPTGAGARRAAILPRADAAPVRFVPRPVPLVARGLRAPGLECISRWA